MVLNPQRGKNFCPRIVLARFARLGINCSSLHDRFFSARSTLSSENLRRWFLNLFCLLAQDFQWLTRSLAASTTVPSLNEPNASFGWKSCQQCKLKTEQKSLEKFVPVWQFLRPFDWFLRPFCARFVSRICQELPSMVQLETPNKFLKHVSSKKQPQKGLVGQLKAFGSGRLQAPLGLSLAGARECAKTCFCSNCAILHLCLESGANKKENVQQPMDTIIFVTIEAPGLFSVSRPWLSGI